MRPFRNFLTAMVPLSLVLVAFLNARAISALVEGMVSSGLAPNGGRASVPPRDPRDPLATRVTSADAILDRNPFDHATGPLRVAAPGPGAPRAVDTDPRIAPICEGVRPLVLVGDEDQTVALASIEVAGQRVLRRRGGDVGDKRVAYVGRDRVWLEGATGLCQALLFGGSPPAGPAADRLPPPTGTQTPLEAEIGKHIVRTGPGELTIDRPTVNRILEAQAELMKARIAPEKDGDRILGMKVTGIKPGSVLAQIGIENGDRLESVNGYEMSDPQRMLEAYARLRIADRLELRVSRGGKPAEIRYTIQ